METTQQTPKDFVLLCIDNEIYRYEEMNKLDNYEEYHEIRDNAILVLQEFRQNIVNNC